MLSSGVVSGYILDISLQHKSNSKSVRVNLIGILFINKLLFRPRFLKVNEIAIYFLNKTLCCYSLVFLFGSFIYINIITIWKLYLMQKHNKNILVNLEITEIES